MRSQVLQVVPHVTDVAHPCLALYKVVNIFVGKLKFNDVYLFHSQMRTVRLFLNVMVAMYDLPQISFLGNPSFNITSHNFQREKYQKIGPNLRTKWRTSFVDGSIQRSNLTWSLQEKTLEMYFGMDSELEWSWIEICSNQTFNISHQKRSIWCYRFLKSLEAPKY